MPDGRVHDKITFISAVVVGAVSCISLGLTNGPILTLAYVFAGLLFNGDLDHDVGATCYNRWWIFKYLFWVYLKIMPHRSIWSHGPILGTLGRLIYVGIYVVIGFAYPVYRGHITLDQIWVWISTNRVELIVVCIGLELGAMSHSLADWAPKRLVNWLFKK